MPRATSVLVELTPEEIEFATSVGKRLHDESRRQRLRDAHGLQCSPQEGLQYHLDGALGECAVAKHLGVPWDGGVNSFRAPDVARLQVRSTNRVSGRLIVRPSANPADPYVLVISSPPRFLIAGWQLAKRVMIREYLFAPNGRPPAYFVPRDALLPIDSIPREYVEVGRLV